MKPTERVYDYLRTEGFMPRIDEETGNITFKYHQGNFIYVNNDEDEEFFQLAFPGIYDVTDENRDIVLDAANKTNLGIKVAKVLIIDDSVWVIFENFLDTSPELGDIFPRALNIILGAREKFYSCLN